ncbi:hypothetical protein ISN45_Aa08g014070 [Arabidopsis thaliana x Arabidopsis arenosa]|uniref:Transmembrane protein n=1 Tax=Arabidopsis thaliana x Arabidopsis arenosa TaxID=1240361 RepID=A0A8T1XNH4_9BRAS|nr:hypothetical protein ISN45_Aa08g014070 [Arabidopsis thaliana x Arabidopsis arenosa]
MRPRLKLAGSLDVAMMESVLEFLKEQDLTLDLVIIFLGLVTFIVFMISSFPYRKRIRDWQLNEFGVAISNHKDVLFLFFFFYGATIVPNDSCAQNQREWGLVVLRFVTKSCFTIVSYVVLCKVCAILLSKPPLESTDDLQDKSQ